MAVLPLVSVILPTLNEEKTIEKTIISFIESDYQNVELIVVDGMSSDRTREIVERLKEKYPNKIRLLENSKKYTPSGINIGIKNANGKYIMLASGHASYSKNYISACVQALENNECDVAGGVMEVLPRSSNVKAVAISEILKHPFGIGGAKYRTNNQKKEYVDTVAYGIYKREIFEKVGLFNEELIRNQDIEFNIRLKNAGYKILLIPEARAYYYARDTYTKLWQNNYSNGFWVTHSSKFVKRAYRPRHLVPMLFVLYLISLLLLLLPVNRVLKFLYTLPASLYLALSIYFSSQVAIKHKKIALVPYTFFSFLVLHISYGIGSIVGIFKNRR
ncbi:glycosyltransferase family 2 protein [Fervidobacterium pennivorans]|uniref:glycosyltransferase family 2 protein n=1 Tax=Fervidobacterium pennivorans TaxID=93466 RepID=UPI0014368864|nr:glycosyltransferase family 2 protein [Fervidobacterium pennivorans]QIV78563.1 glycosyltransferase family 2 protein [Fervidobacterium pennivorans subsp. keratinolyticus]